MMPFAPNIILGASLPGTSLNIGYIFEIFLLNLTILLLSTMVIVPVSPGAAASQRSWIDSGTLRPDGYVIVNEVRVLAQ